MLEPQYLTGVVLTGIGATLLIDLWGFLLNRGFKIPSLNFCLVGRWLLHLPSGTFVHVNIGTAREKPGECALGWAAHYLIGIGLALIFVLMVSSSWLVRPTLLPALLFGIVTTLIPLFVLQPALGLGVASSRTQNPARSRLKSLATHTVYGLGLYLWGWFFSQFLYRA